MNIAQLVDERWDSGLTEYALALSEGLRSKGHTVHIGCRSGSYAWRTGRARGFSVFSDRSPWHVRSVLRRNGIQLVNCHTGSSHAMGWWGTWLRDVSLVRTRADARPLRRSWAHRRIYGDTDAVIGASGCISAHYMSVFPELSQRVWTIYPGLPVHDFQPEPAGPVRIALVGRLDPVKGQIYFLDAIHRIRTHLQNEEFLIVGEPKNTPLEELKRFAEKAHVEPWVRFLDRQPDILEFMRTCHVGVVASVGSEAVSRVCLEWMGAGRPVVSTAVGCLPELVSTGENGFLVPPRSPGAMGNCFLGLIRNPEYRQDMGRRAYETRRERFGHERWVSETERVYETALKHRWQRRHAA